MAGQASSSAWKLTTVLPGLLQLRFRVLQLRRCSPVAVGQTTCSRNSSASARSSRTSCSRRSRSATTSRSTARLAFGAAVRQRLIPLWSAGQCRRRPARAPPSPASTCFTAACHSSPSWPVSSCASSGGRGVACSATCSRQRARNAHYREIWDRSRRRGADGPVRWSGSGCRRRQGNSGVLQCGGRCPGREWSWSAPGFSGEYSAIGTPGVKIHNTQNTANTYNTVNTYRTYSTEFTYLFLFSRSDPKTPVIGNAVPEPSGWRMI